MPRDTHKFIRPCMTDVGRGPEVHRLSVRRRGQARRFMLPPEGARVPWNGAEGHFWKRRLAEGAIEIVDPKPAAANDKPASKPAKRKSEES